jgi:predicted dehydrogenase
MTSAACVTKPTRTIPLKQLFYGDLKAIVKTSHLVKIDYPKFIVHGTKGSFIKYGIDQQETSLKANIMPGEPVLRRMIPWACWSM